MSSTSVSQRPQPLTQSPAYLIKNGDVYDGSGGPAQKLDLRVRDGVIAEMDRDLAPLFDETVVDAAGLLVTPGLIDLHTHVFTSVGRWSVRPEEAGLRTGVTTLLDTGTAGALTYEAFHQLVMPDAAEDIFALLNIALIGCLQGYPDEIPASIGELSDARLAHAPSAVECINRHRDRLLGVKVRLTSTLADGRAENEQTGFREAIAAAEETGLPLMVHHALSQIPLQELLSRLRPGDIYTHLYHPHTDGGFTGEVSLAQMQAARARGVLFDVGHGKGAFSWQVAERACREYGFWPDTISTDIHQFNIHGPVIDLPTTMTKFLALGMPLEQIIAAATLAPARAMRLDSRFGRLLPGRQADITLLRLESGQWPLTDVLGDVRTAPRRFRPVHVLKRGVLYPLD
ncbi:MAG: amidohydrolase family protein [Armatimonadota bacterium]